MRQQFFLVIPQLVSFYPFYEDMLLSVFFGEGEEILCNMRCGCGDE